jgi:PAS domain S-box-containing protein
MSGPTMESKDLPTAGPNGTASRIRSLVESAEDGIFVVRRIDGPQPDYLHIEIRGGLHQAMGVSELVGKTVRDISPDRHSELVELFDEVLKTGQPLRFDHEAGNSGRYLEVSVFPIVPTGRGELTVHLRDMTGRRRVEAELRELNRTLEQRVAAALAERRILADLVETWGREIVFLDTEFRLMACNRLAAASFEAVYGNPPAIGVSYLDQTGARPEYQAAGRAAWERALAGEDFVRLVRPGSRVLEAHYRPIRDEAGVITGACQIANDVTEREAERALIVALEAERGVLADIIESSPVMVRAVDTELRYIALNAAAAAEFEDSYGIRPKVGDSLPELLADWPERLEAASLMWRRAFGGESFRIAVQRESSSGMRCLEGMTAPLTDADGRCIGAYQHVYDVTERIVQQQRLSEAEADRQLWADLVDEWNADLLVADKEFRWIAVNRSASDNFERLYGVRPEVGVSMLDQVSHLPHVRDGLRAHWQRALDGDEYVDVSTAFRDDEARRRHFEIRFSALRNESGEQIGAYQFVYDVTSRISDQERLHEVEEALRQSQKMEAVGQLTGGLAHDFNNLLAAIGGSIDMVGARIAQGRADEAQRYLDAGKTSVKRAADLTHRLLAFSRRQTLSPTAVAVQRLLGDMAELVHRTAGPTFVVETRALPDLWPVMADAHQLENAVLNLCINARDAMPQGGTIAIDAQNRRLEAGAFGETALAAGDYVAIRVSDTGVGISGEVIDRVFEPFFTTKSAGQGTGLGLSMVYGFARQSNGIVQIESRENEGTAVTIFLPRHDGDGALGLTPEEVAQDLHGAGEILVVDDEMLVRMMVADGLSDAGFVCAEAGDGAEAMRHIASDARIDLLVSDVGLPGGMNGRELADAARQLRPELKVLFITGYADKAVLDDIGSLPGTEVMLKPFDIDKLVDKVAAMVTQQRQEA